MHLFLIYKFFAADEGMLLFIILFVGFFYHEFCNDFDHCLPMAKQNIIDIFIVVVVVLTVIIIFIMKSSATSPKRLFISEQVPWA